MWFSFGRSEGFPTQYPPNATAVAFDTLDYGIIAAFLILFISFGISLPSLDFKSNLQEYSKVFLQLLIGCLVLLGNFGQDWETAVVRDKFPYRAGIAAEINATLGVHIGLRSVNVTLKSSPEPKSVLKHDIINYNERFTWTWDQGRFGFGPYAGRLQQEFRAAQLRGAPIPILWVVDYFVIDGEGFRFGRFYRTSGWYCHICMWAAFASWLLAVILFRSVIIYGAYCIGATGILQLTAILVWCVVKNPSPLNIPFETVNLTTHYGSSFWITFCNGVLCIAIAITIMVMDNMYDNLLYTYFGIDPLTSFDQITYITREEENLLRHKNKNDIPLIPMAPIDEEEEVEYIPVYKKRGSFRHIVQPPPISRANKPNIMRQRQIV